MGNMIEIMADNHWDKPSYEGFMTGDVVTVATLLRDSGYNTYMAGKWHLGKTKDSLPAAPGFERSIVVSNNDDPDEFATPEDFDALMDEG